MGPEQQNVQAVKNDPTLVEWRPREFYLGTAINFPGQPNGNLPVARRMAAEIMLATGHRCTSRWMYHDSHVARGFGKHAALSDLVDIASADYVVAVPLTKTSRGCHVEFGFGYGMDKPIYIIAPIDRDPTAFDFLGVEPPSEVVEAVQHAIDWFELGIKVRGFF